jgi:hypothetical protein
VAKIEINKEEAEKSRFTPIPEGMYDLMVSMADEGPAKSNPANRRVSVTIDVIDGPMTNRKIFDGYNTVHTDATTQAIGQRGVYMLGLAVGLRRPVEDTDELLNIPFKAYIGVRENKDTGELQNYIKTLFTAKGVKVTDIVKELKGPSTGRTTQATEPVAATPAPPAPAGSPAPWLNK